MRRCAYIVIVIATAAVAATVSFRCYALETDNAMAAIRQAETDDVLVRNAAYLFLRLAGVVWIVVEWVAAVVLWRCYRLLKQALRERGVA